MSVLAISNDDLLDYVLEKDMEDAVSRVILNAVTDLGPIGQKKVANLLMGRNPNKYRTADIEKMSIVRKSFGRLSQFDEDQILDFMESLNRLGLVKRGYVGNQWYYTITPQGTRAIQSRDQIGAMIPWPLAAKDFPLLKPFHHKNCKACARMRIDCEVCEFVSPF